MKGWLAIIAVVCVIGGVGYKMRVGNNEKLIAAPAVNDRFIADLNALAKGHSGQTWAILKVVAVDGDRVELAMSKKAYTKSKGAERDYDNGAADSPDYYEKQTTVVPHSVLVSAVKDNAILYVRR